MRSTSLNTTGLQFTRFWFRNRNLKTFLEFVYPKWSGRDFVYLELGVFEGMSLTWMFQHVLTSEGSRAVGIDPWLETTKLSEELMDKVRERAFSNLDQYMHSTVLGTSDKKRLYLKRGNSAEILRRMHKREYLGISKNSVDLCMVDGNHNALAVWDDLRLVFDLVKPGGWIVLDDVENDHEKGDHVKHGLESWKMEMSDKGEWGRVNFLWKHRYCECYEKME